MPPRDSLEELDQSWSRSPARAGEGGRLNARDLDAAMTAAAREAWPPIHPDDLDTSLAAGDRAHVLALSDPRRPVSSQADEAAMTAVVDATERAVAVQRLGARHEPGHAEWARAGVVIPVIGAAPGAGASVLAATLFDTLDAAGVRALLVDAADPQRSGLAAAARNQGNPARTLHPDVGVAFARRGEGWMAQLATRPGTVASASMVPSPDWWLPQSTSSPQVTVVDLGWDPWALSAAPLRGPGAWMEYGSPSPRPILVVPATRPGLAHANGVLERLRPWVDSTRIAPMARLVVSGARRWPRDVPGVASALLRPLLADAVFIPQDPQARIAGVGPDPVSPRLRRAVTPLLTSWGLTFSSGRAPRPMSARSPNPRT